MFDNDRHLSEGFFANLGTRLRSYLTGNRQVKKYLKMHRRATEEYLAHAIARPREILSGESGLRAGFEARLEARWGHGLDLADLVVHEGFESGRWSNDLLQQQTSPHKDRKFEALVRLHGKAIMTTREVLLLLRSGYSSGGLARWRTVHEVWVVFSLLADADSELSRRYLAHDAIEASKGQEDYEQTWEALGFEPPDWTSAERERTRTALSDEYGDSFLRDYGWAAPLFNGRAPRFNSCRNEPS